MIIPEAIDDTILLSELDQALGFIRGVNPVPSSQHLSPPSDPPPLQISPSPAEPTLQPSSLLVSYLPRLTSPEKSYNDYQMGGEDWVLTKKNFERFFSKYARFYINIYLGEILK